MKKRLLIVLCVALILSALTGCSKKSGGSKEYKLGENASTSNFEVVVNSVTYEDTFDYQSVGMREESWGIYQVTANYSAQPKEGYTVAIIDFSIGYIGKESTSIKVWDIPELVYDDGYTFEANGIELKGTLIDFTHTAGNSNVATPLAETSVYLAELSDKYVDSTIKCEPLQTSKNNYTVCIEVPNEVETGDKALVLKMRLGDETVEYKVR